jgi:hypothetical protein
MSSLGSVGHSRRRVRKNSFAKTTWGRIAREASWRLGLLSFAAVFFAAWGASASAQTARASLAGVHPNVPAVITVTLNTDAAATTTNPGDGPGQSGDLRNAILNAPAGSTIQFSCGGPCVITLNGPLPPITEDLTIDGGTPGNVVIDGNGKYRVFFVDTGTVELENLLIRNALAKGGNGGVGDNTCGGGGAGFGAGLFINGITAAATVTVSNVYFQGDHATGGNGCTPVDAANAGNAGGGGLGGNGGNGSITVGTQDFTDGGGGGVLGPGANGPTNTLNGAAGGEGGGGGGDYNGNPGYAVGPGGVGYATNSAGQNGVGVGGNGGFGGGGGAGVNNGGNGGFGGGGGSGDATAGNGGVGGGGAGAPGFFGNPGTGGVVVGPVTGGNAATGFTSGGASGGGAAAGPDIFVNQGTLITLNSTSSGAGATGGPGGTGAGNGTADATPAFNYAGTVNGATTKGPVASALGTATVPTLTVTTTADSGSGSLRDALAIAAELNGGNIVFDPTVFATPQTITSASTLNIPSNTTITGATSGKGTTLTNLVTVSGGGSSSNFSVFTVGFGVTGVAISNLIISNGHTTSEGGGIITSGALTLTDCTLSNNFAAGYTGGNGNGGGALFVNDGSVSISRCTFSGNTGSPGGAITLGNGTLTIDHSTFTGNMPQSGYDAGGAIFVNTITTATITNSTFSGNTASSAGGIQTFGTLSMSNSILSGNAGGDCSASGNSSPCPANGTAGNIVGVTAIGLSPLGSYGGPTQTMLPLPGSPAICAINPSTATGTDQRGDPRTTSYGTTTCQDPGSVESDYALSFTQQPTDTEVGAAISPAPTVTLTESGTTFTGANVTVPLTLTGNGTLSNGSATTNAGVATYNNLTVSAAGTGDLLTATLSLNPSLSTPLSITAASGSFNVTSAVPGAPTGVIATAGNGQATITFTPPSSPGGSPITSYTVTSSPGGVTAICAASPCVVTGLVNGTTYTFTVTATNSIGTGPASVSSNPVTPSKPTAQVALSNLTQTYTGQPLPVTVITTPAGLAVSVTYNGSATVPTNAGVYAVVATINDPNYMGTGTGTLVINRATPSVTWAAPASIAYGTALGAAQLDATASVPGTFTYTPAAGTVLGVGPHTLSVTFTPTDTTDYTTPPAVTNSITVNSAQLTITPNAQSKVYGTTLTIPGTAFIATGLQGSDSVSSVTMTSLGTAATAGVGPYTIAASGATGTGLGNYAIVYNPGTLTVTPAPLQVSANSTARVYGAANPTFTGAVTGAVNGDAFTEVFTTKATVTSGVGPYAIVPSVTGANLADYSVTVTNGTLTITAAPLTVTANNATRAYGAPNPTFSGTASGLLNGDAITITGSTTATTTSPVGPYPIVPAASGAALSNYTVQYVNGTLTVTKAAATVTLSNLSQTYTGQPLPVTVTTSPAGLAVSVTYNGSTTAPTTVGSYAVVATITDPNSTGGATGTLVISKAAPTINWAAPASIVYGTALSGTQLDATASVAGTFTYSPAAGTVLAGGVHTLSVTFVPTDTTDYTTPAAVTTSITVTSVALEVTANNATRVYGTANPAFTGTVAGAVNGDSFTESFSTTATQSSNVGTYAIVPHVAGNDLGDYTVQAINGTLSISQAGDTTALSASASSLIPGQSLTLTAQVTSATTGTPTGSVTFMDGSTQLGTATLTNGTATFTVSTLAPGVTHSLTADYGGDINFTASVTSTPVSIPVVGLGFTLTVNGLSSQTVIPGGSVTYQFNVTPLYGSYPGVVNFAVSGLPAGTTGTFSPSSIPASGGAQTITLTLQTASATASNVASPFNGKLASMALATLLLPFAGMRRLRRSRTKLGRMICLALLLLGGAISLGALNGCATGNGFLGQSPQNYAVTVTATSGSVQQTSVVTLNLQ